METGLGGRTVLVTGASRNMGRAAALAFAREGANLALCTSSRMEELETVAGDARAAGATVFLEKCDVAEPEAVCRFVENARARLGSVDVAVNMAGFRCEAPFLEVSGEEWARNIAVNLTGPSNVCRAVLPGMMDRRWGRIINISGVSPFIGGPAAKAMVKLGIVGFTRGLAREFGGHGITVNCVGPGYVARESDTAETAKALPSDIPMQRKGTYQEVVSLMIYLASENAGFITGQCYLANGGAAFL